MQSGRNDRKIEKKKKKKKKKKSLHTTLTQIYVRMNERTNE